MAKIYLSPAAHEHDRKCAYDSACSENNHCNQYIDQMIPYLDACGIEWKRSDKANTGDRYDITIAESNAFEPDIHYVAHTNAFNGTVKGSRLHVYWSDEKSREWGQKVLDWRKKIYPYPVALKDGSGLGEVKKTKAVCLYEELVFHDNLEDAKWMHEHMREMAEYAVRAICDILGVAFVDPYAKPEEPEETLYRPQVGAFKDKANADRLAAELKAKGYSTYIVQADGLYKVQTGAFIDKANADRMADKLKADGYTVYISTTGGDRGVSGHDAPGDAVVPACHGGRNGPCARQPAGLRRERWVAARPAVAHGQRGGRCGNGRPALRDRSGRAGAAAVFCGAAERAERPDGARSAL